MSDFHTDKATLEELVEKRVQFAEGMKELEAGRKVIDEEILNRLTADKINAKVVGDYGLSKAKRVSFSKVTMEFADSVGAVKPSIDTRKLKALYDKGTEVPGSSTYEYLMVREIKPEGSNEA